MGAEIKDDNLDFIQEVFQEWLKDVADIHSFLIVVKKKNGEKRYSSLGSPTDLLELKSKLELDMLDSFIKRKYQEAFDADYKRLTDLLRINDIYKPEIVDFKKV